MDIPMGFIHVTFTCFVCCMYLGAVLGSILVVWFYTAIGLLL